MRSAKRFLDMEVNSGEGTNETGDHDVRLVRAKLEATGWDEEKLRCDCGTIERAVVLNAWPSVAVTLPTTARSAAAIPGKHTIKQFCKSRNPEQESSTHIQMETYTDLQNGFKTVFFTLC